MDQPAAGRKVRSRWSRIFRPTENDSLVRRQKGEYKNKLHQREWTYEDGDLLHFAARHSHLALLDELLVAPGAAITVNAKSPKGFTPLELAMEHGNIEVIERLLQSGTKIGTEALLHAVLLPDLGPLNILLRYLKSTPSKDSNLRAPIGHSDRLLFTAIRRGHLELVDVLLDAGVELRCENSSAFHVAIDCENTDILKRLMEQPNSINALSLTNEKNLTPLQAALAANDHQSAKILLTSSACQIPSDTCQEALRLLFVEIHETRRVPLSALGNPRPQIVKLKFNKTTVREILPVLVAGGAKVDDCVFADKTLLQHAVCENDVSLAALCLENGSQPNLVNNQRRTPLFDAVIRDSKPMVECLLKHGCKPDLQDEQGDIAAFEAVRRRYVSMLTYLLNASQNTDIRNKHGQSLISLASEVGDLPMLTAILKKSKAHLSAQDKNQNTPLLTACKVGFSEIAMILIKAGAYCNDIDRDGKTPLHILLDSSANEDEEDGNFQTILPQPVVRGHAEVIKALINGGAHLDAKDGNDKTPLHHAVIQGHVEAIKALIQGGANVEEKDCRLLTPLYNAVLLQKVEAVKALVEGGAKADLKDRRNQTPLHHAVVRGDTEIIALLLRSEAGIDQKDCDGNSALYYATIMGNTEVMKALIDGGADVNQKKSDGKSLLHSAASKNSPEMAELLLNAGAATNVSDGTPGFPLHLTPLQLAVSEDRKQVADFLLDWSIRNSDPTTDLNLFRLAVAKGNATVVLKLIQNGLDPETEVTEGRTALHFAIDKGDEDLASAILKHGASGNNPGSNTSILVGAAQKGMSQVVRKLLSKGGGARILPVEVRAALHLALCAGNEDMALILLQNGCEANSNAQEDPSLLVQATTKAMIGAVRVLLSMGADPNSGNQNRMGGLPLHIAINQGNLELTSLLLEKGAKPSLKSGNGYTPLQIAVAGDREMIARKLMEYGERPSEQSLDNGITLLQVACSKENLGLIRALLEYGGLDAKVSTGNTPVQMAVASGNVDIVKEMHKRGANIHSENLSHGTSLVQLAVAKGDAQMTKCLLEHGASSDPECAIGNTPLQIAVARGSHEIATVLLSFNKISRGYLASQNILDGTTLLQIAMSREDDAMVDILVRYGAHGPSADATKGNTPLQIAVAQGKVEIARKLMENGDDPNKNALKDGTTLLQIATSKNDVDMVWQLIHNNADRGGFTHSGLAPFSMALNRDLPQVLNALLSPNKKGQRFSPDMLVTPEGEVAGSGWPTGDQMTPLMFAALIDSPGLVKVLISHNAEVDKRDAKGRTALQMAVLNGGPKMIEVVDELVKGKADPTRVDEANGANAIHIAILKKDMGLLKSLLVSRVTRLAFFDFRERSSGLTTVELARRTGFNEAVRLFEIDGYFQGSGFRI